MIQTVIKEIAFEPNLDQLLVELRIKDKKKMAKEFLKFIEEAKNIARPKAIFNQMIIQQKGEDGVLIGSENFKSRILSINLENTDTVFPFVATCGSEMDDWSKGMTNILHSFWAESIKETALTSAIIEVQNRLKSHYKANHISIMTPGSLEDWPLTEQKKLFCLLGKSIETIGVVLTDNNYMLPVKTISCLAFPSDEAFFSCQLCPREDCPKRRAPFESNLMEEKYSQDKCDIAKTIN